MTSKEAASRRLQQRLARIEQERLGKSIAQNVRDWESGCAWACAAIGVLAAFIALCESGVV